MRGNMGGGTRLLPARHANARETSAEAVFRSARALRGEREAHKDQYTPAFSQAADAELEGPCANALEHRFCPRRVLCPVS